MHYEQKGRKTPVVLFIFLKSKPNCNYINDVLSFLTKTVFFADFDLKSKR